MQKRLSISLPLETEKFYLVSSMFTERKVKYWRYFCIGNVNVFLVQSNNFDFRKNNQTKMIHVKGTIVYQD